MDEFDLEPGPLVGELLDAVHEAQAIGEIEDTKSEALNVGHESAWKRFRGSAPSS